MTNADHLKLLHQGVDAWNAWREEEPSARPILTGANLRGKSLFGANLSGADLSEADLSSAYLRRANLAVADLAKANLNEADLDKADLRDADLREANLRKANLSDAHLPDADLSHADLREAKLMGAFFHRADLSEAKLTGAFLFHADLSDADLSEADLREADLRGAKLWEAQLNGAKLGGANCMDADFSWANLRGANLSGADLRMAKLVETNLENADLTGCRIYGISAWGLHASEGTKQQNLVITAKGEPEVTADDIEVAQFLYLMLHNEKVRRIIDTITSKVVLILGRFTPERKAVLDALRNELRRPGRGYVPVMFDFEKPGNPTTVETVTLLARMARFVIADLTDAKSVLQELQAIVPTSPKLAVQPVIISTQDEPGMFDSIEIYRSVLKTHPYDSLTQFIADLDERVIRPAEAKVLELRGP